MSEEIKIKIFDEEYKLRINSINGKKWLTGVGAYVDQKMKEVSDKFNNLPSKHVAVLAALNIADEYMSAQKNGDVSQTDEGLKNNIIEMSNRIEGVLQSDS